SYLVASGPEQVEVPGEAFFQVFVDVGHVGDVVSGDAAAVAHLRVAAADEAANLVELRLEAGHAAIERLAVLRLADVPELAGLGEGDLGLAILVELLDGGAAEQAE